MGSTPIWGSSFIVRTVCVRTKRFNQTCQAGFVLFSYFIGEWNSAPGRISFFDNIKQFMPNRC